VSEVLLVRAHERNTGVRERLKRWKPRWSLVRLGRGWVVRVGRGKSSVRQDLVGTLWRGVGAVKGGRGVSQRSRTWASVDTGPDGQ
jgi:hypothetical protein